MTSSKLAEVAPAVLTQNFTSSREEKVNKGKIRFIKAAQKSIYLICLIVLLVITIFEVAQCVVKYLAGPTYISSGILAQNEAAFPAMTICPEGEGYKLDVLQAHGIGSVEGYNLKENLNWTSNQTDVTESQLFHLATFNLDQLVKRFYIRYFKADPDDNNEVSTYLDLTLNSSSNPSVSEQRHRSFGRCYTFYPADRIRNLGIYYTKIDFLEDVKVYFHRKDQFLDLSGRMGYKIFKSEKVQSQLSFHDIKMLAKARKGGKSCEFANYDQCMYSALVRVMQENTPSEQGCTVPWVLPAVNICKQPQNINATFWEAWNRVTNQLDDCPIPCETLMVNLGAKNYEVIPERNYGQLYLYYATRTMFSEELELYTTLSLIAEIGGHVGLFIGLSFWNFAEFLSLMMETSIKKLEAKQA